MELLDYKEIKYCVAEEMVSQLESVYVQLYKISGSGPRGLSFSGRSKEGVRRGVLNVTHRYSST